MKSKEIILSSVVSHGYKSGLLYAKDFSNINGSNKSSKGVYTTGNIKYGKFGYSMYIKGLDKGINSNAYNRSIIFHSNKLMKKGGGIRPFDTLATLVYEKVPNPILKKIRKR